MSQQQVTVRYFQTIEVKILPCTATLPRRLKATTTSGKTMTVSEGAINNNWTLSLEQQAYLLAQECLQNLLRCPDGIIITGCGRLNNGNYIFTTG